MRVTSATSTKESISTLFFVAFVVACIFIGSTIQRNREVAQRRLAEPVRTVGILVSLRCDSYTRGVRSGGPQPYAVLKYKYSTVSSNPIQHVLVTTQGFDTDADCAAFEMTNSNVAPIWYEKEKPEKASLRETESYTWGGLYGLVLAIIIAIVGMFDQKRINKKKRKS